MKIKSQFLITFLLLGAGCASSFKQRDENIKIVTRYYQAYNKGDIPAQVALLSSDFTHHSNSGKSETGTDAYRKFMEDMYKEVKEVVDQTRFLTDSEQNVVAVQAMAKGEFIGSSATKKPTYEIPFSEFFEIKDAKIKSLSTYYNELTWQKQVQMKMSPKVK